MDDKTKSLLRELQNSELMREFGTISLDGAKLLHFLVKLSKPKHILEVGTSNGYSTIWLAEAANEFNSKITSIEITPERTELARQNLEKLNLLENVSLLTGDVLDIIPSLNSSFDFIFIDAMKKQYLDYLKLILPKLSNSALIIADNTYSHRAKLLDYLEFVRTQNFFESISLPMGKGIELTVKIQP